MPNKLGLISNEFVVQERSINVTDEKLNRLLSNTYETARKDANSFKWYNHYGIFFSFGISLFITLLTSTFNDYEIVNGNTLTIWAWVACVVSIGIGTLLAIVRATKQSNDEHADRDKAVKNVIDTIINDDNRKQ